MKKKMIPIVAIGLVCAVALVVVMFNLKRTVGFSDYSVATSAQKIESNDVYDVYEDGAYKLFYQKDTEFLRLVETKAYEKGSELVEAKKIEADARAFVAKYSKVIQKDDVITTFLPDGIGGYELSAFQKLNDSMIHLVTANYDFYGQFISAVFNTDAYVTNPSKYVETELSDEEAVALAIDYIQTNLDEIKKKSSTAEEDYFDFLESKELKTTVETNQTGGQTTKYIIFEDNSKGYTRGCTLNITNARKVIFGDTLK